MSTAKVKSNKPAATARKVLVVYGMDEDGNSRAGKFAEAEFAKARKAAAALKLELHEGDARKLSRALQEVKFGNIYGAGPEFIPKIGAAQYDELVKKLTGAPPKRPAAPAPQGLPASWDNIEVGHLVLGQADSAANGWWPAVVIGKEGDMLKLQAVDYPEVTVTRHRVAVALLYTKEYVAQKDPEKLTPGLPANWDKLAVGELVIAEEGKGDGWWEAKILQVDGDTLTLQWRDYPQQPKVKRQRTAVALLNPRAL